MRAPRVLALFGLGHMGRLHAEKLRARGDLRLRFVDPAQGQHDPVHDADLALIAAPTAAHMALAAPLLDRGIPCLVEKPLAATVAEALPQAHSPLLSVAHVERFNPTLDLVAGLRPRFLSAERLSPPQVRGTDVDVIADLMIHDLDLALALLGDPLQEVRAVGMGLGGGPIDIANARLALGEGVAQLSASRISRARVRTLRLFAADAYWSLDLLHRRAHRAAPGDLDGQPIPVPPGDPLSRMHAAWLAATDGGPPYPVSGAVALQTLRLAEAVRAAL